MQPVNGSSEQFLTNLGNLQSEMIDIQRRMSSGLRVGRPSDDPAAALSILQTLGQIAGNTQVQTNLNNVKAELQTGDSALQQAVQTVEQAISVATQGATSSISDTQRSALIGQTQGILQQLVNISQTSIGGRYIFSGDSDQVPLYGLQSGAVVQLASSTATRTITDSSGSTIWVPKTATDIFDNGTSANGNVFQAVTDLLNSLTSGDASAAADAVNSLHAASDHLNQQLGLYGIAENLVSDATDAAAKAVVTEKQTLSTLRDADVAGDAVELSQVTLVQQAALSARAKMNQQNLFDFMA